MVAFRIALLLLISAPVYATEVIQNSGVFVNNGAIWYKPQVGENWQKLVGSNVKLTLEPTFNTSKGQFPVPIEKNLPVDLSNNRLGKAATGLLKALPGIGTALALADLACDLAQICWNNGSGGFQYTPSGTYPGQSGSCEEAIGWPSGTNTDCNNIRNNNPGVLYWFRSSNLPATINQTCTLAGVAGWTYSASGWKNCSDAPNGTPRAPSDTDWASAEPKLNVEGAITPLLNGGGQLPIQVPTFNPINKPIGTTTTTLKDSAGNVTGTQTTATTLNITNASTSSVVNNYNVTETTITTTYNNSNQVTGTTTTAGDAPPKTPDTKPPIIEFDQVPDTNLQTVEVPGQFTTSSWGGGTCPPDTTINYKYGTLTYDMQPACDFATGIQPVTLVLAAVIAAYLISGVRLD